MNQTPSYREKPGANPFLIFLIFAIFILLPIGIFVYIGSNSTGFFDKAKEFFANIINEAENESDSNLWGLKQEKNIDRIESINLENLENGTRTVGNDIVGYLNVPIDWSEHLLGSNYPLQSYSFRNDTSALYATTLDSSSYTTPDQAISSLEKTLEEDGNVEEIGPINSIIINGTQSFFPRRICYHDKSTSYNQCDYIFLNYDHDIIYISLASKENPKELEYILESYTKSY